MLHVVADVWADLGDVGKVVAGAVAVALALAIGRWLWRSAKRSLADVVRENSPPLNEETIKAIVAEVVDDKLAGVRYELKADHGLSLRDAINRIEGQVDALSRAVFGPKEH